MRTDWPGGAEVAVSLTFDVDAESGWLGTDPAYATRLSTLSEGRFGITRGLPRILEHPRQARDQGHVLRARRHRRAPHRQRSKRSSSTATRSATTAICTSAATRSRRSSRRRRSIAGIAALKERLGVTPKGYRSPSWELTPETFALLKHYGFAYDSSLMGDDRPYVVRRAARAARALEPRRLAAPALEAGPG